MTTIIVGSAPTDRSTWFNKLLTVVDRGNPANASGTLTTVDIFVNDEGDDMTGLEVATFFVVSGNSLSTRDSQSIPGTLMKGVKSTFAVDLDVVAGDYIGFYCTAGYIERDTSGGSGVLYAGSDAIPCVNQAFTLVANNAVSIQGSGSTPAVASGGGPVLAIKAGLL